MEDIRPTQDAKDLYNLFVGLKKKYNPTYYVALFHQDAWPYLLERFLRDLEEQLQVKREKLLPRIKDVMTKCLESEQGSYYPDPPIFIKRWNEVTEKWGRKSPGYERSPIPCVNPKAKYVAKEYRLRKDLDLTYNTDKFEADLKRLGFTDPRSYRTFGSFFKRPLNQSKA